MKKHRYKQSFYARRPAVQCLSCLCGTTSDICRKNNFLAFFVAFGHKTTRMFHALLVLTRCLCILHGLQLENVELRPQPVLINTELNVKTSAKITWPYACGHFGPTYASLLSCSDPTMCLNSFLVHVPIHEILNLKKYVPSSAICTAGLSKWLIMNRRVHCSVPGKLQLNRNSDKSESVKSRYTFIDENPAKWLAPRDILAPYSIKGGGVEVGWLYSGQYITGKSQPSELSTK